MGRFDGILLASDWDGTLFYNGRLNERDIKKIRYFCENGGIFTLCSGRTLSYMRNFFDDIKPNTYAITLNGAIIIHPDTEEILYKEVLDSRVAEILDIAIGTGCFSQFNVFFEGEQLHETIKCEDYPKRRDELSDRHIHKILLISDSKDKVAKAKAHLAKADFNGYLFVCSWEISLEILNEKAAKGYAIKRLAEKTGARLTVAVGDYENDIQMIQMADIGYAVANATDSVKAVCDRVTVSAEAGAIAQIIDDLENEFN